MTKKWWQSWTFWANVIAVVTIVADKLLELNILKLEVYGYIMAAINIILRLFKTESKVTL